MSDRELKLEAYTKLRDAYREKVREAQKDAEAYRKLADDAQRLLTHFEIQTRPEPLYEAGTVGAIVRQFFHRLGMTDPVVRVSDLQRFISNTTHGNIHTSNIVSVLEELVIRGEAVNIDGHTFKSTPLNPPAQQIQKNPPLD